MRTRIALTAASTVTFIGSTVTLLASHVPVAAAATRADHQHATGGGQGATTVALSKSDVLGPDRAVLSTADLRTVEHSGHEPIGTFAPLSQGRPGRHRRGAERVRVSVPGPATSSATSSVASFAPAPAPAPVPAAPSVTSTPAPVATVPVTTGSTDGSTTNTSDWQCIRIHESGDVYNDPTRPSGAYGILDSTWLSFGYSGWPYEASATLQDQVALTLYHEYGWQPWSSRFACGL